MPPSEADSAFQPAQQFNTTHWSVVLQAGEANSPRSTEALAWLYQTYWYPLYAYVRRRGHNRDDAQDLTQEFFAHLLERNGVDAADPNRGRFRTFLLTSLKNFLNNDWKKANREKRGGGQKVISLDEETAETRFSAEPAVAQTPDAFYDRGWAEIIVERALAAMRAEFVEAKKRDFFVRLKVFVWGEKSGLPYADMARELAMTEGAVKVAVHRLRQRYRELLRAEVARTVSTPAEVNDEVRYLASVIRDGLAISGNVGSGKL